MKILKKAFIILFIFFSCKTSFDFSGRTFLHTDKYRTLEIVFDSDSNLILKNVFKCPDIDPIYREIAISYSYKRVKDTIFVDKRNKNHTGDLYVDIPSLESEKCSFLNTKNKKNILSPSYITDYNKYGRIPNFEQDTMYIIKDKIFFYKNIPSGSMGFIFR